MALTFKVFLKTEGGVFQASCPRLGLSATAASKKEASAKVNALIKERVALLEASGKPIPPEPQRPVGIDAFPGSARSRGGCSACGSRKKNA